MNKADCRGGAVTLASFIIGNIDEILREWVEFARTLASGKELDVEALRDHAKKMLLTVAAEMTTSQTAEQQRAKSRGEATVPGSGETVAGTHGDQRYLQGFKLEEMIGEYRALRATVIRLWSRHTTLDERAVDELTRFNEGIDQLMSESVTRFSRQVDRARQLFMGVLGHDLRTDLQVILACAERLEHSPSKETWFERVWVANCRSKPSTWMRQASAAKSCTPTDTCTRVARSACRSRAT
jgi:K+-sensing histidine kinase KdpD